MLPNNSNTHIHTHTQKKKKCCGCVCGKSADKGSLFIGIEESGRKTPWISRFLKEFGGGKRVNLGEQ